MKKKHVYTFIPTVHVPSILWLHLKSSLCKD